MLLLWKLLLIRLLFPQVKLLICQASQIHKVANHPDFPHEMHYVILNLKDEISGKLLYLFCKPTCCLICCSSCCGQRSTGNALCACYCSCCCHYICRSGMRINSKSICAKKTPKDKKKSGKIKHLHFSKKLKVEIVKTRSDGSASISFN